MVNKVGSGKQLKVVLADTVKGGDVVITGLLAGIAATDGDGVNEKIVELEGTYTLAKATGAITAGAAVYWDATAKKVTTTATSNTLIGHAMKAAASADVSILVRISN